MSQTRRLRIWEAAGGLCVLCGLKIDGVREAWIVEHKIALGLGGSDTDDNCAPAHETCRRAKDKIDVPMIAKAKRMKARHIGIRKATCMPGSRQSKWKRKMDGTVVLR
jgi:5-methylcytosine-specific restriction endonuclease McrA